MLTGHQIRQARKLLGWGRIRLSRTALVAENLIDAIESTDGPAWLTEDQEGSIRRALEGSGIRFELDADGVLTAVSPPSPADVAILCWLAGHDCTPSREIAAACTMPLAQVRSRLVVMEGLRLVSSRKDETILPSRRVYLVTDEGRRAGLIDQSIQDA